MEVNSRNTFIKTSIVRKIIFTIIGLLIIAFVFLYIFSPGGGNYFRWTTIPSFISGLLFISLGYTKRITLWYLFFILFSLILLETGMGLASTGLYPPTLVMIITFGLTLLLVFFITFFLNVYTKPFTYKKEIILVVTLLLLLIFAYCLGFLNGKAVQYAYNTNAINLILPLNFSSLDQCNTMHVLEEAGFCYGYFANLNNNINLCSEYIDKNVDPLLDKDYIYTNCVTGFTVYQNNSYLCKSLNSEVYQSKCLSYYFVAKKEFNKCQTITTEYWAEECLKYDSAWYIKKYSEIVYQNII